MVDRHVGEGENFEIGGVEGVDSMDAIGLHGCHKLQIEHIAANHWTTLAARPPTPLRLARDVHARHREESRDSLDGIGGGTRSGDSRGFVTTA